MRIHPESAGRVINPKCRIAGIPARMIVDHPYLRDSLIHHADEDDKYLILLLRRKQSAYVLGEEGIVRKNLKK